MKCSHCNKETDSGRTCVCCHKVACPECESSQFADKPDCVLIGFSVKSTLTKTLTCNDCQDRLSGHN